MENPQHLKYTKTHEWVHQQDDARLRVGITQHAQKLLGDVVFVELPEQEKECNAGDELAVIESVKAAADVYAPVAGVVVAVNHALLESPALINSDPYGSGWLVEIRSHDPQAMNNLLDAKQYQQQTQES